VSSRQENRARQARLFFELAGQNGAQFISSVFAVEEGFHLLLMRRLLAAVRAQPNYRTWKDYRAKDPIGFRADLDLGRRAFIEFETMLKLLSIDILAVGGQVYPKQPILEAHIIADAKRLLAALEVDAMDAFQFATMNRFKIDQAASSDSDWLMFPSGTLYTFS
jgi:hypothetical protein